MADESILRKQEKDLDRFLEDQTLSGDTKEMEWEDEYWNDNDSALLNGIGDVTVGSEIHELTRSRKGRREDRSQDDVALSSSGIRYKLMEKEAEMRVLKEDVEEHRHDLAVERELKDELLSTNKKTVDRLKRENDALSRRVKMLEEEVTGAKSQVERERVTSEFLQSTGDRSGTLPLATSVFHEHVSELEQRLKDSEDARAELRKTIELQDELCSSLKEEKMRYKMSLQKKFEEELMKYTKELNERKDEYDERYETSIRDVKVSFRNEERKRQAVEQTIAKLKAMKFGIDEMLLQSAEHLLIFPVKSGDELRTRLLKMRTQKVKKLPAESCRRLVLDVSRGLDVFDVAALPTAVRRISDLLSAVANL